MDTAMQPGEHLPNRMSSALREKSNKASESKKGISLIVEVSQSHRSDGQRASCREDGKLYIGIVF